LLLIQFLLGSPRVLAAFILLYNINTALIPLLPLSTSPAEKSFSVLHCFCTSVSLSIYIAHKREMSNALRSWELVLPLISF